MRTQFGRAVHAWRRPAAGVAIALVCALLPATAAAGGKHPQPLYWGALVGGQFTGTPAPWDMHATTKFEHVTRKPLSIIQFSAPFSDCYTSPCSHYPFAAQAMQDIRNYGAIPFFNWASQSIPSTLNEPKFQLSDLIHGTYDQYIREFAEAAREWGHPFFLRFDWEMNGFWFPWSEGVNGNKPGEFVTAWRHVHDIFTEVGATNATWVWCPNVDFTRKLLPLNALYPGNKYVDWTCLDGFNWGDTPTSAGWMSFSEIFKSTYQRVLKIAPHKPMMIGETGSEQHGGSKPAWIRNMLRVIPSHFKKVRALIWFDQRDQRMNWPIESSKASSRAFAQGIGRQVYRPNIYGSLANGPIRPPTWGQPPTEPAETPPSGQTPPPLSLRSTALFPAELE